MGTEHYFFKKSDIIQGSIQPLDLRFKTWCGLLLKVTVLDVQVQVWVQWSLSSYDFMLHSKLARPQNSNCIGLMPCAKLRSFKRRVCTTPSFEKQSLQWLDGMFFFPSPGLLNLQYASIPSMWKWRAANL